MGSKVDPYENRQENLGILFFIFIGQKPDLLKRNFYAVMKMRFL
jgi:hypothetical protein